MKTESSDIEVDYFETALIVPLHIQAARRVDGCGYVNPNHDPSSADFLDNWIQSIRKGCTQWEEIGISKDGDPPQETNYPQPEGSQAFQSNSEFLYFHPFVRNFLYLTRDDKRAAYRAGTTEVNRNLRILKRTDITAFTVAFELQGVTYTSRFKVSSCWLYLFDTQIAMLGLRLNHESTQKLGPHAPEQVVLNLALVQRISDVMRHVYSPYWSVYSPDDSSLCQNSAHTPLWIELEKKQGSQIETHKSCFGNFRFSFPPKKDDQGNPQPQPLPQGMLETAKKAKLKATDLGGGGGGGSGLSQQIDAVREHFDYIHRHREPFTASVWKVILEPLEPQQYSTEPSDCLRFEHIRDERAVLMSYISVAKRAIRSISDGDWLRLACVDSPGKKTTMPYSPEFFRPEESPLQGYTYDRFWHSTGESLEPSTDKDGHGWMSTRWLCSGYSFTCVGDSSDYAFFRDDHAGALSHFRHHYFALTMIAMFHHASLLVYKHRLAEASDNMLTGNVSERVRNLDFREAAERLAREIMRFRTLYWFSEVSNQVQGAELFDIFRKHLRSQDLFNQVTSDTESSVALLRQWDSEDQARATQSLTIIGAILMFAGPLISHLSDFPASTKTKAYLSTAAIIGALVLLSIQAPSTWLYRSRRIFGASLLRTSRSYARIAKVVLAMCMLVLGSIGLAGSIQVMLKQSVKAETTSNQKPADQTTQSTTEKSTTEQSTQKAAQGLITAPPTSSNTSDGTEVQPAVTPSAKLESSSTTSGSGSNPNEAVKLPQKP